MHNVILMRNVNPPAGIRASSVDTSHAREQKWGVLCGRGRQGKGV